MGETESQRPPEQTPGDRGPAQPTLPEGQHALPPLAVSAALVAWGYRLVALSITLAVVVAAILVGVLLVLSVTAWTIDVMVVLAGLPVIVAVTWIVGRAFKSAGDGFVRGITSTPLVAIMPPPRPPALATPLSALRFVGMGPAPATLGALACLVALVDVWAARTPLTALRMGALAVSCDGLAALAALLLAGGLGLGQLGRSLTAREREAGARYYVLAVPDDSSQANAIAVCAVPGLE